jgi:hypothetical protein
MWGEKKVGKSGRLRLKGKKSRKGEKEKQREMGVNYSGSGRLSFPERVFLKLKHGRTFMSVNVSDTPAFLAEPLPWPGQYSRPPRSHPRGLVYSACRADGNGGFSWHGEVNYKRYQSLSLSLAGLLVGWTLLGLYVCARHWGGPDSQLPPRVTLVCTSGAFSPTPTPPTNGLPPGPARQYRKLKDLAMIALARIYVCAAGLQPRLCMCVGPLGVDKE